jgi:hypothetical protein
VLEERRQVERLMMLRTLFSRVDAAQCLSVLAMVCLPQGIVAAPLGLGAQSAPVVGEWGPSGVLVCGGPGVTTGPRIASDRAGGAYIAWEDRRDEANPDIYCTRLLPDGSLTPGWPPNGLRVTDLGTYEIAPWVFEDGQGGALVLWVDLRQGAFSLFMQRLLPDGSVAPGWPPNGRRVTGVAPSGGFDAAQDANGEIVLGMIDSSDGHVRVHRVTADADPAAGWPSGGVRLTDYPYSNYSYILMAPDSNGGLYATWHEFRNPHPDCRHACLAQQALAVFHVSSGPVVVNRYLYPAYPFAMVPDGAGGMILISDYSFATARFNDGLEIVWGPVALDSGPYTNGTVAIAPDGSNSFVAAWDEYGTEETGIDLLAMRLTETGFPAPGWEGPGVPIAVGPGDADNPRLVADGSGGTIIAWSDRREGLRRVHCTRMSGQGELAFGWSTNGNPVTESTLPQGGHQIVSDGADGAIIAWVEDPAGQPTIRAQRVGGSSPTSTEVSWVRADVDFEAVHLSWAVSSQVVGPCAIERTTDEVDWRELWTGYPDIEGAVRYVDGSVVPGVRYGYRLAWTAGDVRRFSSPVWLRFLGRPRLSIHGATPNPVVRDLVFSLTLASAGPATIELLDISGRRVIERSLHGLSPGRRDVNLGDTHRLAPGIYLVRLQQGTEVAMSKACVIR